MVEHTGSGFFNIVFKAVLSRFKPFYFSVVFLYYPRKKTATESHREPQTAHPKRHPHPPTEPTTEPPPQISSETEPKTADFLPETR